MQSARKAQSTLAQRSVANSSSSSSSSGSVQVLVLVLVPVLLAQLGL